MSKTGRCYLLNLPREIRDMVYSHLTVDYELLITKPDGEGKLILAITMFLNRTIRPELLLVNRQIRQEYTEYVAPISTIVIFTDDDFKMEEGTKVLQNYPSGLLKQMKECRLLFAWEHFIKNIDTESWENQLSTHGADRVQSLPWTPSNHICDAVKQALQNLHSVLSEDITIRIEFVLHAFLFPDPLDDLSIGLSYGVARRAMGAGALALGSSMFHVPTISALASDPTIPWPRPGRLTVEYSMDTTLYSTHEDRKAIMEEDIGAALRAFRQIGFEGDRGLVRWRLKPAPPDAPNYRGFMPEFDDVCFRDDDGYCQVHGEMEDHDLRTVRRSYGPADDSKERGEYLSVRV